jgi:hypothetical protein
MSFFDAFLAAAREVNIKTHGYYATPSEAVDALLSRERFEGEIIEPCSGGGHISRVLEAEGYTVRSSDIREDVYGEGGVDVFSLNEPVPNAVTNPPVRIAAAVAEHLLSITTVKLALLLPWHLLPTLARRERYEPPRRVHVFGEFVRFLVGGQTGRTTGTDKYWAWYVWEKGYAGPTDVSPIRQGGN